MQKDKAGDNPEQRHRQHPVVEHGAQRLKQRRGAQLGQGCVAGRGAATRAAKKVLDIL